MMTDDPADKILEILNRPKKKPEDTDSYTCLLAGACLDSQTRLRTAFEKLNIKYSTAKEREDLIRMLAVVAVLCRGYAEEIHKFEEPF